MSNAIPTPEFTPTPRPRRSSIGQGAALSSQNDASPAPDPSPAAATPPTASAPDEVAAALPAKQGSRATSATPPRPRAASGPNGGAARTGTSTAVAEVPNKRLVGSKDVLLSLPEDLKERMVNTITWCAPYTRIVHQQKFIRKAIEDLCEAYENEYNQGKPFPEPGTQDG